MKGTRKPASYSGCFPPCISGLSVLLLSTSNFPHVSLVRIKAEAIVFSGILLARVLLSNLLVLPWGFIKDILDFIFSHTPNIPWQSLCVSSLFLFQFHFFLHIQSPPINNTSHYTKYLYSPPMMYKYIFFWKKFLYITTTSFSPFIAIALVQSLFISPFSIFNL